MKKLLISAIALMAAILPASAQSDIFENPDNHAYLGARVGLDITSASQGYGVYNNGFGMSVGAIYNIPIWKNLYFEPGLSLFYDTFGLEFDYSEPFETVTGSIRNMGFRIPLVAGYRFDLTDEISIAPFTGPQFNMSFLAKSHIDKYSESVFGTGGFKHFDAQWVFGLGLSYQRYYLAVAGGVGLTYVSSSRVDFDPINYTEHFRRNNFTITFGYNF